MFAMFATLIRVLCDVSRDPLVWYVPSHRLEHHGIVTYSPGILIICTYAIYSQNKRILAVLLVLLLGMLIPTTFFARSFLLSLVCEFPLLRI